MHLGYLISLFPFKGSNVFGVFMHLGYGYVFGVIRGNIKLLSIHSNIQCEDDRFKGGINDKLGPGTYFQI